MLQRCERTPRKPCAPIRSLNSQSIFPSHATSQLVTFVSSQHSLRREQPLLRYHTVLDAGTQAHTRAIDYLWTMGPFRCHWQQLVSAVWSHSFPYQSPMHECNPR